MRFACNWSKYGLCCPKMWMFLSIIKIWMHTVVWLRGLARVRFIFLSRLKSYFFFFFYDTGSLQKNIIFMILLVWIVLLSLNGFIFYLFIVKQKVKGQITLLCLPQIHLAVILQLRALTKKQREINSKHFLKEFLFPPVCTKCLLCLMSRLTLVLSLRNYTYVQHIF